MPRGTDLDLTRTEWLAVSVALKDAEQFMPAPMRKGSLRARIAKGWHWLGGTTPPQPLADPRLEALRRFVLVSRQRREPAEELVPELIAHGFNRAQVEALALLSA